jgi:hypothetical protein
MFVKGTAVLARRDAIVQAFGEPRWEAFVATQEPAFQRVLATDRIDVHKFLQLQEAMLKQFFNDDPNTLVRLGEKSAEWAVRDGPYKSFVTGKDVTRFATTVLPAAWRSYYSGGNVVAEVEQQTVHVRIRDLPVVHPHFELASMGWFKRALEIVSGKVVRAEPVTRAGPGVTVIYYRFTILG